MCRYYDLWYLKNHQATHIPIALLLFGPLISCMMFEMNNSVFRQAALDSNFVNVLRTASLNVATRRARELYLGTHATALSWQVVTSICLEDVKQGVSPTLDRLWALGSIPASTVSVSVEWLQRIRKGRTVVQRGTWLLAELEPMSQRALAVVEAIFQLEGAIWCQFRVYHGVLRGVAKSATFFAYNNEIRPDQGESGVYQLALVSVRALVSHDTPRSAVATTTFYHR